MIRERYFGSDVPFCAWMRSQQKQLPSYSSTCGFVATDVDLHIHRYLTETDSIGTREIQSMMFLEVKTRGGDVPSSQLDTLAKIHRVIATRRDIEFNGQLIRHWGVSFILLSNTTPDDSNEIHWGRFDGRKIDRRAVTVEQLIKLMRFELHPDNLEPRPFRRHHKTKDITETIKAPLGFTYEKVIRKRS